jgi:hypothetical protein
MSGSDDRRLPRRPSLSVNAKIEGTRLALVAREYNQPNWRSQGKALPSNYGFKAMLRDVFRDLREWRPDVVVFAPFSFSGADRPTRAELFPQGSSHRVVILEMRNGTGPTTEVHFRNEKQCTVAEQYFARSTEVVRQREFMRDVGRRKYGHTLLLLCGESNIVRTVRDSSEIKDEHGFLDWLGEQHIKLIINPVHSYMKRWEMPIKRMAISDPDVFVVSLWNRGLMGKSESRLPWAAYLHGEADTDRIRCVAGPSKGHKYWIGIVET